MLSSSKYDIRVFTKVDDIGKDPIDALSNDPLFTYGWFKTIETSKPIKSSSPLYVAAYEEDELVAFLPCFLDLGYQYFVHRPYLPFIKRVLKIGKSLSIWQDHVLMCYSPFCWRSKILFGKNSDKELILSLLSSKIDDICRKERVLFSSFEFVSENDHFLMAHLQNHGYLKFPWWTNSLYLSISWSTFEEYLKDLTRWSRRTVRRDIKKCRESGVEIVEDPYFEKISERLSFFYSNLYEKYNKGKVSPYAPLFFEALSKYAKKKVKVFVAQKEGTPIGFSLFMQHKEVMDAFMTGYDYSSRTNTDFAYFNLSFYEPIKWAIKVRLKRINYRISGEEAKLRRGCKKEQIFSFVKCHNKLINPFFSGYAMQSQKT